MYNKNGLVFLMALLLSAFSSCFAQTDTTSIRGVVLTADEIPMAGAKVIAKYLPNGSLFAAITDTTGFYNLPGIETGGPFSLVISKDGYETFSQTDIYLVQDPVTIDAKMIQKIGKGVRLTRNRPDDDSNIAGIRRSHTRLRKP